VNAYVLAGGRSTRMGRDKALVTYRGRPQVERAVHLLREAGLEAWIAGSRPDLQSFAPFVPDRYRECGPLGGIEAALSTGKSEWNLFLAVDMPLMTAAFLRYLKERVSITEAYATIPTMAGRPMPLCAVYHCELLGGIRRALDSGEYRVVRAVMEAAGSNLDLFSAEAVIAVRKDLTKNCKGATLAHRWFKNVNTTADLAQIVEREGDFCGEKQEEA
jgi:molybdopterin-guanine dinucleotide biosynthesis protein A